MTCATTSRTRHCGHSVGASHCCGVSVARNAARSARSSRARRCTSIVGTLAGVPSHVQAHGQRTSARKPAASENCPPDPRPGSPVCSPGHHPCRTTLSAPDPPQVCAVLSRGHSEDGKNWRYGTNLQPGQAFLRLVRARPGPAGLLRGPGDRRPAGPRPRSEEHTSELQSQFHLVCRLLLEKKKKKKKKIIKEINKTKKT